MVLGLWQYPAEGYNSDAAAVVCSDVDFTQLNYIISILIKI